MKNKSFSIKQTIYLQHATLFGNVYFANFFIWQGHAREEFLRKILRNPAEFFTKTGIKLVTIEAGVKFIAEAHPFEEISISVAPKSLSLTSLQLEFRYINEASRKLLATGFQKIGFLDRSGDVCQVPSDIVRKSKKYLSEDEYNGFVLKHQKLAAIHPLN